MLTHCPSNYGSDLPESKATALGIEVMTSLIPLDQIPHYIASRETAGLIKLVADRATDRLVGGSVLADEAEDIIQTLAMALKANMTTQELGDSLFPYLTGGWRD